MDPYLLKSAACLGVFFIFYKAILENTSIHTSKRFYLLGAVVISFLIPLITFTTYVEVPEMISEAVILTTSTIDVIAIPTATAEEVNYLPYILWSVYGLGVLFFGIKFGKNLFYLISKIKTNPKFKFGKLYHVLITEKAAPHTFFKYLFFNKHSYESKEFPKEVFWHEEAHATQNHSADLVFLSFLQVVFWFNPLFYFMKSAIKLNHEFLADREVLKKTEDPAKYQQLLLSYSTPENFQEQGLISFANSINYSSIKKRFTVMKTQTSKTSASIKGLLLLPLLCVLLYGFSTKQTIEKSSPISKLILEDTLVQENYDIWRTEQLVNIDSLKINQQPITPKNKLTPKYSTKPTENKVNSENITTNAQKPYLNQDLQTENLHIIITDNSNLEVNKQPATLKNLSQVLKRFNKNSTPKERKENVVAYISAKPEVKMETIFNVKEMLLKNGVLKFVMRSENEDKKDKSSLFENKKLKPMSNANDIANSPKDNYPFRKDTRKRYTKTSKIYTTNVQGVKLNQEDYTTEYLNGAERNNKKAFVLQIEISQIKFNGKTVALKDLTKTINAYTKVWEETDYTSAHPSILMARTPDDFLYKVDKEFKKTHYSKANGGMSIRPEASILDKSVKGPPMPARLTTGNEDLDEYGTVKINGVDYYYRTIANGTTYYDKWGNKINITGKKITDSVVTSTNWIVKKGEKSNIPTPPPPIDLKGEASNLPTPTSLFKGKILKELPEQEKNMGFYYKDKLIARTEAVKLIKNNDNIAIAITEGPNNRTIVKILEKSEVPPPPPTSKKVLKGEISNIPPPPPPPAPINPLDHIIEMAKKGVTFQYGKTVISTDYAIDFIKAHPQSKITTKYKDDKPQVVIIEREISPVNSNGTDVYYDTVKSIKVKKEKNSTGYIEINGETHLYVKTGDTIRYKTIKGIEVNEKGEKINKE
jgi:beta-lactamase regulating signal transducer with metallopeptidase domain/biopolymer transport protein ExbD